MICSAALVFYHMNELSFVAKWILGSLSLFSLWRSLFIILPDHRWVKNQTVRNHNPTFRDFSRADQIFSSQKLCHGFFCVCDCELRRIVFQHLFDEKQLCGMFQQNKKQLFQTVLLPSCETEPLIWTPTFAEGEWRSKQLRTKWPCPWKNAKAQSPQKNRRWVKTWRGVFLQDNSR